MARRRRPPIPAIVVLVLLLLGGGYWWWTTQQPAPDTSNRLAGSVEATQYAVASLTSGRVAEVLVSEGSVVKAGDPLVKLDPAALLVGVEQANAGVDAAKALVSQKKDGGTDAEVAEAQARLVQAQAAVKLAQVQLGYATIAAPAAGTVVTVTTNVGQNAAPGRTLVTLVDTHDVWVRAYVPEPKLAAAAVGTQVQVSGDGVPQVSGKVAWVAVEPEFTPNNVETADQRTKLVYEIRVRLSDASVRLTPGQPVDVTLP